MENRVATLMEDGQGDKARQLHGFLESELLPHATGEERHLYPAVEPLLAKEAKSTATMSVDHEFIATYVDELGTIAQALKVGSDPEREALESRAQGLAQELLAILRLHLEKEERVYLPLFEKYLSGEEQHAVLAGMHQHQ
jgi:hemerythrin-like domain-containing protein